MLSMSLRRAGYDVTMAVDGFEAMSLCVSKTFDAILTDSEMPRMNGHELLRWIAANRPGTRYAMMSGGGGELPAPSRCPLLQKPFFPRNALSVIERMLKTH
jgi:two-component system chemotaxis response regulator CheY